VLEAIPHGRAAARKSVPASGSWEQFGVARTSVREAIQGLTASGYLERRGNRPVVAERMPEIRISGDSSTLDERKALVRQLFEVRRTIEPAMSELAARRATDTERADIAALAAKSTHQLDEFRTIDRAFHVDRACGNRCQEVYGKTLGALLRPASSPRCCTPRSASSQVAGIIASSTAALAPSPMLSSAADARPRSRPSRLTSTTSNAA
jgi:GntR family transcriptional repressor for pyruvate dehydrogenase complex